MANNSQMNVASKRVFQASLLCFIVAILSFGAYASLDPLYIRGRKIRQPNDRNELEEKEHFRYLDSCGDHHI